MIITDTANSSRYQASVAVQADRPDSAGERRAGSGGNSTDGMRNELKLVETSAQKRTFANSKERPAQKNGKESVLQERQQEGDKRVEDAKKTIEEIKHNRLEFSVYEDTGQTVIKVIDQKTGDVVKQLPPEELLELAAKLKEMSGVLFDKKI